MIVNLCCQSLRYAVGQVRFPPRPQSFIEPRAPFRLHGRLLPPAPADPNLGAAEERNSKAHTLS